MKPNLTLIKSMTIEERIAKAHKVLDIKRLKAKRRFERIKALDMLAKQPSGDDQE